MNTHLSVITEAQHFNVVARHMHVRTGRSGVYAKPGETQAKAMKRILAASLRVKTGDSPSYPTYRPGMSTADYVAQYHSMNSGRSLKTEGFFGDLNSEPATLYENGAFDFAPVCEVIPDDEAETFDFAGTYSAHIAACNAMGKRPMSMARWIKVNSAPMTEAVPVEVPAAPEPTALAPVTLESAPLAAPSPAPALPGAAQAQDGTPGTPRIVVIGAPPYSGYAEANPHPLAASDGKYAKAETARGDPGIADQPAESHPAGQRARLRSAFNPARMPHLRPMFGAQLPKRWPWPPIPVSRRSAAARWSAQPLRSTGPPWAHPLYSGDAQGYPRMVEIVNFGAMK